MANSLTSVEKMVVLRKEVGCRVGRQSWSEGALAWLSCV